MAKTTATRYVVIQAGLADMSRLYRTPEAAQRAADRINATLERELLGEECWGDGAASIMDIEMPTPKADAVMSLGSLGPEWAGRYRIVEEQTGVVVAVLDVQAESRA